MNCFAAGTGVAYSSCGAGGRGDGAGVAETRHRSSEPLMCNLLESELTLNRQFLS